jgi:hypothetical protein
MMYSIQFHPFLIFLDVPDGMFWSQIEK